MGLDAFVFCDCLERGRLRIFPQPEWSVYVEESGCRTREATDLEQDLAFDEWDASACEHPDGILLHHWIGNIAAVGLIRATLAEQAECFPLILSKVVYSGCHCGDYLAFAELELLRAELDKLADVHPEDRIAESWIRDFGRKMSELVNVATTVQKPIAF